MKKIFTILIAGSLGLSASAQRLFTEDFNYALGQLTDNNGGANVSMGTWLQFSGTAFDIMNVAGSLSYPNYFTSPTPSSGKIVLQSSPTSAEDVLRNFTTQAAASNATVYTSILLNITDTSSLAGLTITPSAAGEYFMTYLPSASTTSFFARLHVRKGSANNSFNLGIAMTSSGTTPVQWIATNFPINTTHLVTYAYTFVTGAANDVAKLWVNAPYSATEPAAMVSSTMIGTEAVDVGRVVIRQATLNTPNCEIDGIKVSLNWADATLPVNLTSFNASLNAGKANVSWGAATEVNVKGYSVEKSLDATNFSEIGFVNATNAGNYSFADNQLKSGNNYYRLKVIDKDGSFKFSQVVVIKNMSAVKAELFPNPAVNNLTVNHSKAEVGAVIHIVNIEGRLVKNINVLAGATQTALNVSDLVKGNYMMVFESNGEKVVSKFTKQ